MLWSGAERCYPPVVDIILWHMYMLQIGAAYFSNGSFEFHPELRRSSFWQSLPEL